MPRHLLIAMSVLLVAVLGLSLYALHMRKTAASTPIPSTDTRPLAPPVAGPTERVILFVAHDNDGSLRPESAQIPLPSGRQQRAEELLRALLSLYLDKSSPHVLGAGAGTGADGAGLGRGRGDQRVRRDLDDADGGDVHRTTPRAGPAAGRRCRATGG